jgi:hypothetical protein
MSLIWSYLSWSCPHQRLYLPFKPVQNTSDGPTCMWIIKALPAKLTNGFLIKALPAKLTNGFLPFPVKAMQFHTKLLVKSLSFIMLNILRFNFFFFHCREHGFQIPEIATEATVGICHNPLVIFHLRNLSTSCIKLCS